MSEFLQLFTEFFVTGLLAFGGGMATLPFLYDMGARRGWFSDNDVLQMIAVSESTPGPIGVNMATYVGTTVLSAYGILGTVFGGLFATLALVLPSVIVIIIISKVLDKFKNAAIVDSVFTAIRPASLALIAASGLCVMYSTFLSLPKGFTLSALANESLLSFINIKGVILGILLFAAMKFFKKLHPIVFIVISAAIGIIFSM